MLPPQDAYRQAREQFKDLVRRGVHHFPLPVDSLNKGEAMFSHMAQAPVVQNRPPTEPTPATQESLDMGSCQACNLCHARQRVVHWPSERNNGQKIFVLVDYPEAHEDTPPGRTLSDPWGPVPPQGRLALLWRLFEKLGLRHACFLSYAVKCFSRNLLPFEGVQPCAQNVLRELREVSPTVVVGFGALARLSLGLVEPQCGPHRDTEPYGVSFSRENPFCGVASVRQVIFLPSLLELDSFPHFRLPVWQQLQSLHARLTE